MAPCNKDTDVAAGIVERSVERNLHLGHSPHKIECAVKHFGHTGRRDPALEEIIFRSVAYVYTERHFGIVGIHAELHLEIHGSDISGDIPEILAMIDRLGEIIGIMIERQFSRKIG